MDDYIKLKTKLQLTKNSNVNITQKKDIDKIENIKIDNSLPKERRIIDFLESVKNPYMFEINGSKVKFEFSEKGLSINQCFENLIKDRINF